MKSTVYFVPVKNADDISAVNTRLAALINASKALDVVRPKDSVAVKVHFGEEGNTGYVRPEHLRVVCDVIAGRGGRAFLSDTNTLYRGKRLRSPEHLATAHAHGFTKEVTGVECIIPDDTKKEETVDVPINHRSIKQAKIARTFMTADALVAVNHFKGHIMTGFGGALKNIGMGCATREGKLAQHCDVAPIVYEDKCVGCGECQLVCPADAIHIENKKSVVDRTKCIGCASCMAACPTSAMFIDFEVGDELQEKMVAYTFAVLNNKKGKACFFNFALRINKECDCWGAENPRIGPDVGILASLDPVAIDAASFDLVRAACGKDIFKEAHPHQDSQKQLACAEALGLGSRSYTLKEVRS